MSGDGTIIPLPGKGPAIKLSPGETKRFNRRIMSLPPMTSEDQIFLIGTTEELDMQMLTGSARERRGAISQYSQNNILNLLDRYLAPGLRTRGSGEAVNLNETAWTVSHLGLQGTANLTVEFADPGLISNDAMNFISYQPRHAGSSWGALYQAIANQTRHRKLQRPLVLQTYVDAGLISRETLNVLKKPAWYDPASLKGLGFEDVTGLGTFLPGDVIIFEKDQKTISLLVIDPWNKVAWGTTEWQKRQDVIEATELGFLKNPLQWIPKAKGGKKARFLGVWRHYAMMESSKRLQDDRHSFILNTCKERQSRR